MRSVIVGALVAFVVSLFLTPVAIRYLRKRAGQPIRELGIDAQTEKRGTPTMGGVIFILATLFAYGVGHVALLPLEGRPHLPTVTGLVLLGVFVCCGLVGFLDDFLKVTKRGVGGLPAKWKLVGQLLVGVGFGAVALYFPSPEGFTVSTETISFVRNVEWLDVGKIGAVVLFAVLIIAASNGVNLTDGLDGQATGTSALVLISYVVIAFWQYRHWCAEEANLDNCYPVRDPLEVALVAGAAAGALIGFLWWNASPAKIFMGDVGALGLGGLLAAVAATTHTMLLLPILGLIFVVESMSVIIQVISFKTTGKRVFRMSPLHHHFELAGWSEVTIVVRFWLITGVGTALGLGVFFADFLKAAGW